MAAKLEEAIALVPLEDHEGQMAVTDLLDAAQDLSCDKHGRIKLNEDLIEGASLKKGAVLLGKVATFRFCLVFKEGSFSWVWPGARFAENCKTGKKALGHMFLTVERS